MERLMRQLGIQGAHLHKYWKLPGKTREPTPHPDLGGSGLLSISDIWRKLITISVCKYAVVT
jgi:hypothetical protein